MSMSGIKALEKAAAVKERNTRAGNHHPYEQRITGDGSDWGEIMRDAYDNLMASACESCTPGQMERLADHIRAELGSEINGDTSDGYHTFNELYHHRAVLFSVIVRDHGELAWKARRHHDGTMYDGMFIVGIETPKGQATYHYDLDPYWEMFDCEELEYAPEWDGHTPDDAIARIAELGGDDDYEAKMDALLCRLTNGKWSKSRAYDLDFMVSCVDEEYEMLYAKEQSATLGSGTCAITRIWRKSGIGGLYTVEFSCGHSVEWLGLELPKHCPDCGAKAVKQCTS